MPLTIPELAEKLKRLDEITLLEVLNISAEDIVDRFMDFIEDSAEKLEQEFEEEILPDGSDEI